MRILHLIKHFDFGGSENHLCELANSLDSLGHEVFIAGNSGRQLSRLRKGVRFFPIRLNEIFLPINVVLLFIYARQHNIQVIHGHQRYAIKLASFLGFLTGIPVVATVHGRTKYDLRSKITRQNLKRIIFVSRFVLHTARRFPEILDRSVYIPNPVPIADSIPAGKRNQLSYISRLDGKHFMVIQLLIREVLPALLKEQPWLTFRILGEGSCLSAVQLEAESFNQIAGREVCLVSGYEPNIMASMQQSALILGVGRVALEALACGVPVLSVNRNHLGSIVTQENFHFYKGNNFVAIGFNPPDATSLLAQLEFFFRDVDCWYAESEQLFHLVKEEFCDRTIASRVAMVYQELV